MGLWSLFMSKKKRMVVDVDPDTYELYRKSAAGRGLTMSDWMREAMDHASRQVAFEQAQRQAAMEAVNTAMQALDHSDVVHGESAPTTQSVELPRPETGHPCVYLVRAYPRNMSPRDCQGMCSSPRQSGRTCFWAPATARECGEFRPLVVRSPNPNRS